MENRHKHVALRGDVRCSSCKKRVYSLETRRVCPYCNMEISRTGLYPHMKYHCKKKPQRRRRSYSTKNLPHMQKQITLCQCCATRQGPFEKKKMNVCRELNRLSRTSGLFNRIRLVQLMFNTSELFNPVCIVHWCRPSVYQRNSAGVGSNSA